jgi:hypothetical protein
LPIEFFQVDLNAVEAWLLLRALRFLAFASKQLISSGRVLINEWKEFSVTELLQAIFQLKVEPLKALCLVDEVMLRLERVNQFLHVARFQIVRLVQFIELKVIYLPKLGVHLAHLLDVFLEFLDIERAKLFEALADEYITNQLLINDLRVLILRFQLLKGGKKIRQVKLRERR